MKEVKTSVSSKITIQRQPRYHARYKADKQNKLPKTQNAILKNAAASKNATNKQTANKIGPVKAKESSVKDVSVKTTTPLQDEVKSTLKPADYRSTKPRFPPKVLSATKKPRATAAPELDAKKHATRSGINEQNVSTEVIVCSMDKYFDLLICF